MIRVLEYAGGITYYAAMCILMAGVYAYRNRLAKDDDQVRAFAVLTGLFWPIALCLYTVSFWWDKLETLAALTSRQIGIHLNTPHMEHERIIMMEEDAGRMGRTHGTDLALRFDYDMCDRCFGSGCAECQNRGLKRRRLT